MRSKGTGSYYQECSKRAGCPPVERVIGEDGILHRLRPEHDCRAPWVASVEGGYTKRGTRRQVRRRARSETHAKQLVREMLRAADAGQSEASASTTVKTWCEKWLAQHVRRLGPATYSNHASHVRLWIIPTIGHKRLDKLTPADVRAVQNAVLDAGRKGSTACRVDALLKQMLTDAQVEGHAVPERVLKVEPPVMSEPERGDIPVPDAVAILTAALTTPTDSLDDGHGSRWAAAFLQGMRPAEARGLTWDCVDFGRHQLDVSWQLKSLRYNVPRDRTSGFRVPTGYIARQLVGSYHLVRPKTKAGRRVIPMVPWMEAQLLAWRDFAPANPWGLVWPRAATDAYPERAGWPRNDAADRDEWRTLCARAGVGEHDLYSCRHTTATLLREAGASDDVITAIMGHASIRSTTPYLHPDLAERVRAALQSGVAARLQIGG